VKEWTPGEKHPETSAVVFKNVWNHDLARRILIGRCKKCGQVIKVSDEAAIKELVFECGDAACYCMKNQYSSKVHRVCSVCYDMWHALYANHELNSVNYFKELDEKDAKAKADRRRNMGLGGIT